LQAGESQTYITDPLFSADGSSLLITANDAPAFSRNSIDQKSMMGYDGVILKFYVPNKANLNRISLYLSNDTTYTNYSTYVIYDHMLFEGYNEIYIDFKQLNSFGTFNPQELMQSIQVRIEPNTGKIAEVYFDSIEAVRAARGNVMFTMDDQWITQYTKAFPILNYFGYRGTIAVIPDKVGTTNYMSISQLRKLYDLGWDLVNHTYFHTDLSTVTKEEQRTALLDCTQWLNAHGFTRASDYVIYPYGGYNADTLSILAEEGYKYGRTLVTGLDKAPFARPFETKCVNLVQNLTVDAAKAYIDAAISTGSTVQFVNHRYGAEDSGMFYAEEKFEEIVRYVNLRRDKLNVTTVSNYVNTFK
jgi:peptidoglycan/xylan/chitin deacetylase (PgdA/CDA1 family)